MSRVTLQVWNPVTVFSRVSEYGMGKIDIFELTVFLHYVANAKMSQLQCSCRNDECDALWWCKQFQSIF